MVGQSYQNIFKIPCEKICYAYSVCINNPPWCPVILQEDSSFFLKNWIPSQKCRSNNVTDTKYFLIVWRDDCKGSKQPPANLVRIPDNCTLKSADSIPVLGSCSLQAVLMQGCDPVPLLLQTSLGSPWKPERTRSSLHLCETVNTVLIGESLYSQSIHSHTTAPFHLGVWI